jgi:aspartate kinase
VSRLLRAAQEAKNGSRNYDAIVDVICSDHVNAGNDQIRSRDIAEAYANEVKQECHELVKVLESAQHLKLFNEQVTDIIISHGEKLSCRFMTAMLRDRGVDAEYIDIAHVLSGGDDQFKAYRELTDILGKKIAACGTKVPVITGYFGPVPGGILKTVGRGYTDLCAAFAAISVHARELQIWKEVDGIFTADPRKVPTAKLIPTVRPAEAAELTFYGSEVIHPFTMEQVMREHIPVRIKNVMNPKNNGTVIAPEAVSEPAPLKKPLFRRKRTSSSISSLNQGPRRPTAVTIKPNIVVMNVHSNKRVRAHGFLMKIFQTLDERNLSVDLISSSEVHVSLALHSESPLLSGVGEDEEELRIQNKDLQLAYDDLKDYGSIDLVPGMAILSLVGHQLNHMVGISGRFFSVLGENNINIEMISQGKSLYLCPQTHRQPGQLLTISQVPVRLISHVSLRNATLIEHSMLYIQTCSLSWTKSSCIAMACQKWVSIEAQRYIKKIEKQRNDFCFKTALEIQWVLILAWC